MTSSKPESSPSSEATKTSERVSDELSALLAELTRRRDVSRLQASFADFVRAAWPLIEPGVPLRWGWAVEALCLHLQAVAEGRIERLLVNIPPGTGKSSIVSVLFPCWIWTRRPETKVMCASHGGDLALRDSVRRRDLVLSAPWYRERFDGFTLSDNQATKSEYINSRTGFMFATSVGGDVLGRRAELTILDDPHKTKGAESEVERAATAFWFNNEWSTRRNRDSGFSAEIIIMQRLHEGDISGIVLGQGGWVHLRLPMYFETAQRCETSIGWSDPRNAEREVLDPKRFTQEILKDLETRLGPYGVAGQFQQRPAPAGGGIIRREWLRTYTAPDLGWIDCGGQRFRPLSVLRFATVDLAVTSDAQGTKGKDPDFTVIGAWAVCQTTSGPLLALVDLFRARIEGPDIEAKLAAMHKYWRFQFIAVEQIAGFLALGQSLKRAGLPIRDIGTSKEAFLRLEGDKIARAYGATPFMANRGVWLPDYAPWLETVTKELTTFPAADHDDVTDCVTSACSIAQKLQGFAERRLDGGGEERVDRRTLIDRGVNVGEPEDDPDYRPDPMAGYKPAGFEGPGDALSQYRGRRAL